MGGTPRESQYSKFFVQPSFMSTPTICASFVKIGNIFREAAIHGAKVKPPSKLLKNTYRGGTPENDQFKNFFKYFQTLIYY